MLALIVRDWPAAGTEVKFRGEYQSFNSRSKEVSVSTEDGGYRERVSIRFPGSNESTFADYRNDDLVEVTAVAAAAAGGSTSDTLTLEGKSIVRVVNPRSLVTDQGRELPALDFTVEREEWKKIKRDPAAHQDKTLRGCGVFAGYTGGGHYYKVTVKKLFFDYGDIELYCGADKNVQEFLKQLKDGDEVLFEFSPQSGRSYKPIAKLLWMSRLSDPDKRITFPPVKVG